MPKRRVDSQAIPRRFDLWQRELLGIFTFLINCPVMNEDFGERWTRGVLAHHKKRFMILVENPPRDLPPNFIIPRLPEEFK